MNLSRREFSLTFNFFNSTNWKLNYSSYYHLTHYEVPVKCCAFPAIQPQSAQQFCRRCISLPGIREIARVYGLSYWNHSVFPRKPYYFYAEPVCNAAAAYHLTALLLKCWRKKQVPTAICITFHTNFTIRPGGHSNFAV